MAATSYTQETVLLLVEADTGIKRQRNTKLAVWILLSPLFELNREFSHCERAIGKVRIDVKKEANRCT
jgi:hypothetical protein